MAVSFRLAIFFLSQNKFCNVFFNKRCFSTVLEGPYLAFSAGYFIVFSDTDRREITPVIGLELKFVRIDI